MKYDAKEFKKYPEIMNKEQMRIACHISKRTALYLLQFNLIPHTCTGKKTRCYSIKKSDVIAFMNDREVNPEKYIAPENWYKYGSVDVKAYKIRIQPQLPDDTKKIRRYYESKLFAQPDVMGVSEVVSLTGYNRRTVSQWIRLGKLRSLVLLQKYMIPKCYLIDCGNCYSYDYDGYIFVDAMGTIFNPNAVTENFSKILKRNGLRHIRFHDLRHSCASLLLANDVPMKQIQEWLGHSDISTTANIYSHLDYKSKITSANVMDNVLALPDTKSQGW